MGNDNDQKWKKICPVCTTTYPAHLQLNSAEWTADIWRWDN